MLPSDPVSPALVNRQSQVIQTQDLSEEDFTNDNVNIFHFDESSYDQVHEPYGSTTARMLYSLLHRSITKHDLAKCYQLLKVLPSLSSLDPYIFFRFIMILIDSNPPSSVDKNVVMHLELLLSNLDLSRPDVFVEYLAYFLRNDRVDDARELLTHRNRYIFKRQHRFVPYVESNLRCYEFLLHHTDWQSKVANTDTELILDKSIQGWLVNAIDCLKKTNINHEYFVIRLVDVLLAYRQFKKAYLLASEFQRRNSNNISAQLLLLRLIRHFQSDDMYVRTDANEDQREAFRKRDLAIINNFSTGNDEYINLDKYPIDTDLQLIRSNLLNLCPSHKELMNHTLPEDPIETLKGLMDGMECVREIANIKRWKRIGRTVDRMVYTEDTSLINQAYSLWQGRYKKFWTAVNFPLLAGEDLSQKGRKTIEKVVNKLKNLDREDDMNNNFEVIDYS